MSEAAIVVNNLSKVYQIGSNKKETLRETLSSLFKRDSISKENSEFWALRDVSFEIKKGEAIGFIGKNGAGKSTLLKILSRITEPTTGKIEINGRVSSLLEVGTGFHPELTGKENVYLNGTILGMTRREVKLRFDEIISFSGVEKFINTPVKHYSSGMYVRLAFAVAAHLEPEILIVDEVLAVGDAEFQKKCLGKMNEVSKNGGRTVLFVSHNMNAIKALCNNSIYLKNGNLISYGETEKIINQYQEDLEFNSGVARIDWEKGNAPGDEIVKMISIRMIDDSFKEKNLFDIKQKIGIEIKYEVLRSSFCPVPNVHIFDKDGEYAFVSVSTAIDELSSVGVHTAIAWIPPSVLNVDRYKVGVAICTYVTPMIKHFFEKYLLQFETGEDLKLRDNNFNLPYPGPVRPTLTWENFRNI